MTTSLRSTGATSRFGPGVEPGEQQQVLDQVRHPLGLGLDPAHRERGVRRHRVALAPGQLGVAADGGERVAQLVRGVGDELAHLGLARLPRGERVLDVVEHVVERLPHPADLRGRVGVLGRDADGQRDLAPVERELRDLLGGRGDPVQRAQAACARPCARRPTAPRDGEPGEHGLEPDELRPAGGRRPRAGRPSTATPGDDLPVDGDEVDVPAPGRGSARARAGRPSACPRWRSSARDRVERRVVGMTDSMLAVGADDLADAGRAVGGDGRGERARRLAGDDQLVRAGRAARPGRPAARGR